jgi:exosortase/archaeosortase family protein
MTPALEVPPRTAFSWQKIGWIGVLVAICYAATLQSLLVEWGTNGDMGHGFFVPLISGYIIWRKRAELLAIPQRPNWLGLGVVIFGGVQFMIGSLGYELFTARTAFIVTIIGVVWFLCGTEMLKKLAFPLQILASQLAASALSILDIPVLRLGNILELPNRSLSVVEACSGIRSLLSLTFLSLVYGYFFEKKRWIRLVLFLSTVPVAIIANAARVTMTGIMTQIKPELADGFFHESTGWVIFTVALLILVGLHHLLLRTGTFLDSRRHA